MASGCPNDSFRETILASDLFSLDGRIALVTGGSRGIGKMIAKGYLEAGCAKVYISARKAPACLETAEELGPRCIALPHDISTLDGIKALTADYLAHESRLDILLNNAGAAWGADFDAFPESGWDKVMDTNVKGPFFLTQKLLPLLEKGATADDPSRVINVGSIDGIRNAVFDTFSYGPSKAALHSLTKMLALHLGKRNIIVNAIAPGPFPTWMLSTGVGGGGDVENTDWDAVGRRNPRGRVGTPEDIAGLAIFLASRAGAFTVGEVISCDGGTMLT